MKNLLLTILASSTAILGFFAYQSSQRVSALQAELEGRTGAVTALEGEKTALAGQVEALQAEIAAMKAAAIEAAAEPVPEPAAPVIEDAPDAEVTTTP